ncbi:HAD family hydrolase [Candidatus Stoquefichus massiliensis]|uniref:HAD family hydrolase n=1 Tax=Candidatus Stoquefichus massiliensis TaxID=1470350 RepID=UPI000482CDF4|nr:HAD family phosphatase [Candidatus Stoquefichus massiliensis]
MKNIIFDIGNVLLRFQPRDYLKQFYDQETVNELMGRLFASDEWIELDRGTMMIHDVIEILTKRHPQYSEEITFVLNHWTDMMTPIVENVKIAYQLKEKGYSLYLLSNFHLEAIETMFHKYDFFKIFDGKIISAHVHCIKPDHQIYQLLIDKYALAPKESVFIDDSFMNANTADELGITGIYLPYEESLEEKLKALHIL